MAFPVVQSHQTFTGSTTFTGSDWEATFASVAVGSYSQTMLIITLTSNGFDNPSSITWGGQSFTLLENPAGGLFSTIGYLVPAAAATHDIIIHSTHAGGINSIAATAIVLSGAPSIGAHNGAYGFGNSVSASVTTTEDNSLTLGFSVDLENSTQTIGAGQTSISAINATPSAYNSYKTAATKGTSVSLSASSGGGSTDMSMFVIEILSIAPALPSNFFLVF